MAPPVISGTLQEGLWIKKVPSRCTAIQVAEYLSAIEYEPAYDAEAIASGQFPINLDTLTQVMRLHLLTFPFENTAMHYTVDHAMDVSIEGIFERLVKRRRGSYCFGQNGLLLEMLRGLGFRAYGANGRTNLSRAGGQVAYTASATHLVVLVQPSFDSNQTYVADVGYGPSNVTRPILLSDHPDNVVAGLSDTERHRLTRTPRLDSSVALSRDFTKTAGDQWNMEVWHKKRDSPKGNWEIQYSFNETEIFPSDCAFASFGVSQRPAPRSFLWTNVICLKLCTVDEGNLHLEKSKRPMYRITLFGKQVWKTAGPNKEVLRTMETEQDRAKALRDYFGIEISDEDIVHMTGRAAAYAAWDSA